MGVPTKLWCEYSFSFYPKCDMLMNNIIESSNNGIPLICYFRYKKHGK